MYMWAKKHRGTSQGLSEADTSDVVMPEMPPKDTSGEMVLKYSYDSEGNFLHDDSEARYAKYLNDIGRK
jgi:hypothetical protein